MYASNPNFSPVTGEVLSLIGASANCMDIAANGVCGGTYIFKSEAGAVITMLYSWECEEEVRLLIP